MNIEPVGRTRFHIRRKRRPANGERRACSHLARKDVETSKATVVGLECTDVSYDRAYLYTNVCQ